LEDHVGNERRSLDVVLRKPDIHAFRRCGLAIKSCRLEMQTPRVGLVGLSSR
jgi:hypothetical protein